MSRVLKLTPKPPVINAVLWDGSDEAYDALVDILPQVPGGPSESRAVAVFTGFSVLTVPVDYYVVNDDGFVNVFAPEAFHAAYEVQDG